MGNFEQIEKALMYIDNNLETVLTVESVAERFHFSPFYFHRMFSIITGKSMAAYIRDRRLAHACELIYGTDRSLLQIGLDCGYHTAQSFSRAFKNTYGLTPREYRKEGLGPNVVTVDELIMRFTNRLRGGIYVHPKIIKRDKLIIAGVSGDGNRTAEVWEEFETLIAEKPLSNQRSENGYEIRIYEEDRDTVHVGHAVFDDKTEAPYTLYQLPASHYASFDVYVAEGYESENEAMNEWLVTNNEGYRERLLGNAHYCVEYYDQRFNGSEAGSIVEIWIPIEKD